MIRFGNQHWAYGDYDSIMAVTVNKFRTFILLNFNINQANLDGQAGLEKTGENIKFS